MSSQGPYTPAAVTSVSSVGGSVAWNPILPPSASVVVLTPSDYSHWLYFSNFGFSVPSGAIITGISVKIEKYASTSNVSHGDSIFDIGVQLNLGSGFVGNNYATGTRWPVAANKVYVTYGTGTTDLWGLSVTPSEVNSSSFGVGIYGLNGTLLTDTIEGYVDGVNITVYYNATVYDLMPLF